jgi:hypothetical protein
MYCHVNNLSFTLLLPLPKTRKLVLQARKHISFLPWEKAILYVQQICILKADPHQLIHPALVSGVPKRQDAKSQSYDFLLPFLSLLLSLVFSLLLFLTPDFFMAVFPILLPPTIILPPFPMLPPSSSSSPLATGAVIGSSTGGDDCIIGDRVMDPAGVELDVTVIGGAQKGIC